MSTLTVYADTSDGVIISADSSSYSAVLAGTGSGLMANTDRVKLEFDVGGMYQVGIGQMYVGGPGYMVVEGFLAFDTSALGSGVTVTDAKLSLYCTDDYSSQDFTVEAFAIDWGGSLTTADWQTDSDLGSATKVATLATSGITTSAHNEFSDVALASNINKTGYTYIVLASDRTRTGTAPDTGGTPEFVHFSSADESGTGQDPKLTVTYEIAGQPLAKRFGGVPFMGAHGAGFQSPVRRWIEKGGIAVPQTPHLWRPAHGSV